MPAMAPNARATRSFLARPRSCPTPWKSMSRSPFPLVRRLRSLMASTFLSSPDRCQILRAVACPASLNALREPRIELNVSRARGRETGDLGWHQRPSPIGRNIPRRAAPHDRKPRLRGGQRHHRRRPAGPHLLKVNDLHPSSTFPRRGPPARGRHESTSRRAQHQGARRVPRYRPPTPVESPLGSSNVVDRLPRPRRRTRSERPTSKAGGEEGDHLPPTPKGLYLPRNRVGVNHQQIRPEYPTNHPTPSVHDELAWGPVANVAARAVRHREGQNDDRALPLHQRAQKNPRPSPQGPASLAAGGGGIDDSGTFDGSAKAIIDPLDPRA